MESQCTFFHPVSSINERLPSILEGSQLLPISYADPDYIYLAACSRFLNMLGVSLVAL